MNTIVLAPKLDDRYEIGKVTSRIGLQTEALVFTNEDNLFERIQAELASQNLDCVLVDEAQFLTRQQVFELSRVTDDLKIPVLAYVLAWADNLNEIKAICHCGRKATMVLRVDENENVVTDGAQIEIGGNDRYISVCRMHFMEAFYDLQVEAE